MKIVLLAPLLAWMATNAPQTKMDRALLPPLPKNQVYRPRPMQSLGELSSPPVPRTFILSWTNEARLAENYFTKIEGSTNLHDWAEVDAVPFQSSNTYVLANDRGHHFVRVANIRRGTYLMLAWDPSPSASVVGYWIYTGIAPRYYTNGLCLPGTTNNTVLMSNLVPNVTYHFAMTAFTASGLESEFSAECIYSNVLPPVPQPKNLTIKTGP